MENLKRQIKRITSIILIITILVGVLPNFGLLKLSNAVNQAKMIVRPGVEEFEEKNGNKIFKLNVYLNNIIDEIGSTLYLKYPADKMTPCDSDGNEIASATGSTGTSNVKKAVSLGEQMDYSDAGADFFIDTDKGEIYCAFQIKTGEITTEHLMCTITFKITDETLKISDISSDDFVIDEVNDDEGYYTTVGDYYADTDPEYFTVEDFKGSTLTSISIKTNPTEGQKYNHGEEIDLTGLELEAKYSDNTTKIISIDDPDLKITTGEKTGAFADINNKQITFEYKGKTTTLDVNVIDPVIKIEVIDENNILLQGIDSGEKIPTNEEGLYLKTITTSGSINNIPLNDKRITLDSDKADINKVPKEKQQSLGGGTYAGPQTITVTYKENEETITTTFDILVNDVVASIEISETNPPTKTFTVNDTFTKSGAIVVIGESGRRYPEISMSSDSVKVTELDGSPVDLSNTTARDLLVSFGEATATYSITVENKVVSIKINSDTIMLKYDKKINEQQDLFSGVTVTEIMSDGTEGDTKPLDFSWIQNTDCYDKITYEHKLVVWYKNDENIKGEISVRVKDEVTGITVTGFEDKEFVYKDSIDYDGVELTIKYVNREVIYKGEEILELLEYTLEDDGLKLTVSGFNSDVIENNQKVTFTYSEDGSKTVSADVFVNIGKATLEVPECDVIEIYEGKKLSTVEDKLPKTEYGQVEWKNPEKTLTYSEEEQEIEAIYKMNGTYSPFYKDVDCKIKVKVLQNPVVSIEVLEESTNKTAYIEGQSFDPIGMKIKVTYESGDQVTITVDEDTKGITYSPNENLQVETDKITVTYGGKTSTQDITVKEDYVTEITVTYPNNFQQVGKDIDLTNTTIQKKWASELSHGADDTESVTLDMISSDGIVNGKFTVPGNVEITVTYDNGREDKPTAKFTAQVEDAIQSITLNEIETEYWVGDEIDNNISITVNYVNPGNNKTIVFGSEDWNKFCTIKGIDMSKPGTYTLKVSYGEYETEGKTIQVKDYVTEIRVVNNKLIYKLNEDGSFNIQVNKYMASEPEKAILVGSDSYSLSIANVNTSVTGKTEVTVSYTNEKGEKLTDKFNVQVINATVKAVLETTPKTMPEYWGDELILTGASIKVEKQDGTYDTISLPNSAVTVSAYNSKTLAPQTISFTYKYKELNEMNEEIEKVISVEGTLNITLKDYWTGEIIISGIPATSIRGQELDLSKATLSKVMASGATDGPIAISSSMISNFDKNVEGKQTITVTYLGKSATCDVTVTDYITSISMNRLPNKVNYIQGESLDVTGAVLNVVKQSGRIEEIAITKEMISGYNPNKVGQQTVIVNYEGFTTSFIVTVKAETTDEPTKPNNPVTPTEPSKPSGNEPSKPSGNTSEIVPTETKKYLVIFVDYDGTILKTEEVESGKSATEPKVKTRKGYKFIGWDKDFDVVEEDITVKAQYEKIETIEESPKPTQTLGEKDEVKEENRIKETLIPAAIGLGITGLLLLLISILTKKNVEIYAIYDKERELIGKEKISKNNNTIVLDAYKSKLENAKVIEIEINEKTVEKLEGETIQVVIDDETKKYKMTDKIIIKK